ncbi:Neuronal acetylcholine receptor subunit alpha-7 [Mizuhopecten yessoensis]|uniref:Neuronal acetylcholine receptor subunit alpha-7 n=1 Tax=Mizuhopecten yessoensis TaxID=6573 RepID=A0A210PRI6_MIZYE|nr:Neuronal acetylcholine receptor subunit alpha-7 [Mizuhopecten yessoensis]
MVGCSHLLILVMYSDVIISSAHAQGTMDDLVRLRNTLFQNYTKDFRPVYNMSDPIHVTLDMYLVSILDLDEVTGTITLNCVVSISWTDYRLSWNSSDVGITSFVMNASNVWKPRIYITTSSEDLSDFSYDAFDVRVYSNGSVTSSPCRHVKASCSFDMTNFPKDSQTGVMQIASWTYTAYEMVFIIGTPHISMVHYKPNGEWDIDWTSVTNNTDLGHYYSIIDFSIHLARRSAYFIISMTIPVLLLCFLNPFVFLLPASSGERISYTITMFLSLAVYMTVVGENMPKVSDPMAGISYLLLGAMLGSCILILLTIFTLRCDAMFDIREIPPWFLRIVYRLEYPKSGKENKMSTNDTSDSDVMRPDEETYNDTDELRRCLQKEHVMRFIDKGLFCMTLSMTFVASLVFIFYYWY